MIQSRLFDDDYFDVLYDLKNNEENKKVNSDNEIDSYLSAIHKALEKGDISYHRYLCLRRDYLDDKK